MTSVRKIATNRSNAKKSQGPTSRDGKRRASANALRHGLSAPSYRTVLFAKEAEQMVKAICCGNTDALLVEQASIIAESELLLRMVRDQKVAAIERLHDPLATALTKGDKRIAAAKMVIRQSYVAYNELSQLMAKLIKERTWFIGLFRPRKFGPNEPGWRYEPPRLRDEHEALCEALPDLERLLRYERRARSRQKKAILKLMSIKLMRSYMR
jgi:hypothetical protein